ncbi:peptidyl-prolyl cis-trans isomerase sig-7 [Chelonus insularis]|uniref:peptidyl-prolyl cis-trans isomerase sig-7 n=1 Tax=Chelonus insularis TaxID=460826 RepID=UPI0015897043|nr:peptidyl-prolyl cis-trans isomerase sig-7 [Chelonus insularis]
MSVVIETTVGDFTVDLFTKERPQTCRNFLKLCKIKYYNWNLFHTVQSGFIAQTGDPTGTGKGGESVYGLILGDQARYYEAEQMPKIKHDRIGLLSMVNCGDNMLGSQFFITLNRDLQSLDGEHCVFGEIVEGIEVVLKFNEAICDGDHRPYQDIRISHTVILEDPYDDPANLIIPDRSPSPTREVLMSDRIGADEALDDTEGMTIEEINEMRKNKEAKAAATILEIVGDIPDADIAPPENVLFVCKLNPVTNDDDLEIIFSRFGKIIGCEVIRDRQTGDSLQYAFIEFADRKSCEDAYFKMDNVLIDDRRIHVDFSQSVAKMKWKGKGKGFLYNDDERAHGRKDNRENKIAQSKNKRSNDCEEKYRKNMYDQQYSEKRETRKYDRENNESYYENRRREDSERRDGRNKDKKSDRKDREKRRSRSREKDRRERSRSRGRREQRDHSRDRKNKSQILYEKHKDDNKRRDKGHDEINKYRKKRSRDRSVDRHHKKSHKRDRRDR